MLLLWFNVTERVSVIVDVVVNGNRGITGRAGFRSEHCDVTDFKPRQDCNLPRALTKAMEKITGGRDGREVASIYANAVVAGRWSIEEVGRSVAALRPRHILDAARRRCDSVSRRHAAKWVVTGTTELHGNSDIRRYRGNCEQFTVIPELRYNCDMILDRRNSDGGCKNTVVTCSI